MIDTTGMKIKAAQDLLAKEGYSFRIVCTENRRCEPGSEERVIRQKMQGQQIELLTSFFKTEI